MCRRVLCRSCGRPSYAGCGMHVDQVLAGVPKADRCSCGKGAKGAKGGRGAKGAKGATGASAVKDSAGAGGWLSRLFGRG